MSVDLGAEALLCAVELVWETAYARGYQLEISADGIQWSRAYTENSSDGATDWIVMDPNIRARHIRVLAVERATEWGMSLWEFKVQGSYEGRPVADFAISPAAVTVNTEITLDATGAFDADGAITGFDWAITPPSGTGWNGTGRVAQFTPKIAGTHQVTLTVTDRAGNQTSNKRTFAATAEMTGNPVCSRAYFCEGFENGFGTGTQAGNAQRSRIDETQGANGSRRSFYYSTARGQGDAWVAFTNREMKNAREIWVSYYQKITKTPTPTNWFALIGPAGSDYPAFRLGTQKYGEAVGQNGVLGNWSCWNGNPCPAGSVSYDASLDPQGGRRTLPLNQWMCIEIKIEDGKNLSAYITPSIRSDLPDGAVYIENRGHPFASTPIERVRLGYNPQSDSLEGWVDDVIIAAERPGCRR